ncbi:hypothetical protein FRB94_006545 [Tulasnella sp. JGI-2019a]|nr:hypothetical protein FRB93_012114 [Tulasnella sp. JGI-2019a]KAG9012177.1 hypothetical protein FRB94_006545 [Tulasnella sp. JGI-2019a]
MRQDWPGHREYCQPYNAATNSFPSSSSSQGSPQYPYTPSVNSSLGPVSPISVTSASGGGYSPENPSYAPGPPAGGGGGGGGNTSPTQSTRSAVSPVLPSSLNSTTTSFDAVLFPVNEDRPRIVRVPCHAQPQATGPTIWTPLPQEQLNTEEITSMIITHGIGGSALRFPLHLFYGTNSFGDGSPLNRVIQRMTAGKSTYPWAGNLLALKFSGSRRQGYTDATYNDVAPLIASFLEKPASS